MKKYPKPVLSWGIMWRSVNKLDGVVEHVVCLSGMPPLFRTRKQARRHIDGRFGYLRNRPDLRREPFGWKIPIAVRVITAVDACHLHPGNELARALNTVAGYFVMSKRNGGKFIAKDLRKAGFRVRWDAKKGRFV